MVNLKILQSIGNHQDAHYDNTKARKRVENAKYSILIKCHKDLAKRAISEHTGKNNQRFVKEATLTCILK